MLLSDKKHSEVYKHIEKSQHILALQTFYHSYNAN